MIPNISYDTDMDSKYLQRLKDAEEKVIILNGFLICPRTKYKYECFSIISCNKVVAEHIVIISLDMSLMQDSEICLSCAYVILSLIQQVLCSRYIIAIVMVMSVLLGI